MKLGVLRSREVALPVAPDSSPAAVDRVLTDGNIVRVCID